MICGIGRVGGGYLLDKMDYRLVLAAVAAVILAGVAFFLGHETRALLVGETISERLGTEVRRVCLADESVARVVRVLGIHLGPDDILLTLGLRFHPGYPVEEVAQAVERIERRIRDTDSRVTRVFVEPEIAGDPGGLDTPF